MKQQTRYAINHPCVVLVALSKIEARLPARFRHRVTKGGRDHESAVWRAMRIAQHVDMFTAAARKLPSYRRRR